MSSKNQVPLHMGGKYVKTLQSARLWQVHHEMPKRVISLHSFTSIKFRHAGKVLTRLTSVGAFTNSTISIFLLFRTSEQGKSRLQERLIRDHIFLDQVLRRLELHPTCPVLPGVELTWPSFSTIRSPVSPKFKTKATI